MAKKKESLIVASKVKAYIKSKKMMTSSDRSAIMSIVCLIAQLLEHRLTAAAQSSRKTCKTH
ncbi:MAG: hypothetical protein ACYSWZ_26415 [Planctomycetota bacterium]|jgi:hypothetical protein